MDSFMASKIADPTWAPYCLVCSTMGRMTGTAMGWKCEGIGDHFGRRGCGNEIGFDLRRADPSTSFRAGKFADENYVRSFQ